MKEIRCDNCGKVIEGYYPGREIKKINDYYQHNVKVPGSKKENVAFKLEVDLFYDKDPVTFRLCSLDCLISLIKSLKKEIES